VFDAQSRSFDRSAEGCDGVDATMQITRNLETSKKPPLAQAFQPHASANVSHHREATRIGNGSVRMLQKCMELTLKEVQHVAVLARLRLTPEEEKQFTDQLGKILQYMEKLGQVDTSQIEPFDHAAASANAFRDDIVSNTPNPDAILANAPAKEQTFFRVPKIIE